MGDARAPFLLLAHHRSGSNLLTDVLQAHPCIECLNEPFSMHTAFFRECDLQPWLASDFDPRRLHRDLPDDGDLRPFLHALRGYLEASAAGRVVGFKETGLFGKLGWMQAFVPRLKVVLLWRDPRSIVSSVLRSGLMEFWSYRELVPAAFHRLFADCKARLTGWPAGSREELAALAAMSVAARYELARQSLPAFDHCIVSLDAIVHDSAANLGRLCGFLGVPEHPEPVRFLQRRQAASRGGMFSSFRDPSEASLAWRGRLEPGELAAIDQVLDVAGWTDPEAGWEAMNDGTTGTTHQALLR